MSEPILALPNIYEKVKTFFADEGMGTSFAFGWSEAPKQDNQGAGGGNRIVYVPGDGSGSLGSLVAPKGPGRNPRPLANLIESFTVFVWGYDATKAGNDLAQYEATRLLYDSWYRAMYHVAHGTFSIVSQAWVTPPGRLSTRGAAIQVVCAVQAVIPDLPYPSSKGGDIALGLTTHVELPSGEVAQGCSTL